MKAFVIDDEAAIRWLLVRVLTEDGWEVETAADGRQALSLFKPARFNLALVDVNMPGDLDGIAVASQMREQDARLRILIMSADPENVEKAKNAGFGPLVPKPFDRVTLGSMIGPPPAP
jgi:two-component system nitrogen regulation response regulator GlnG